MESSDKINSIISAASNNQFRSKVKLKRNLVKRNPYQEISNSVQFAYTRKRNVWENERLQLPANNSSIYHNKLCYVLGIQLLTFLRILIISIEQRENQFASTRKKRDFPRYFLLARFFAPRSFPLPLSLHPRALFSVLVKRTRRQQWNTSPASVAPSFQGLLLR